MQVTQMIQDFSQVESQQSNLKQVARGIGHYMNSDKKEFMSFR